jgi:hypothetical protein
MCFEDAEVGKEGKANGNGACDDMEINNHHAGDVMELGVVKNHGLLLKGIDKGRLYAWVVVRVIDRFSLDEKPGVRARNQCAACKGQ